MNRHDLCRTAPFTTMVRDASDTTDGLTLEGYGAVFDSPTVIDSWEGRFTETIKRGAFRKSLEERTPRIQFDHGMHPLIGSIPIGTGDVREDQQGLYVRARLTDNWLIQPVRDAIASGAVDGMSFRFTVLRDEWHDSDGDSVSAADVARLLDSGTLTRTLKEVRLSEVGPVVWPAYESTSVTVRDRVTVDLSRLRSDPDQQRTLDHLVAVGRRILLGDEAADLSAPPDPGHPDEDRTDAPPDPGHPSLPHPPQPHRARATWPAYRERLTRIREE